MQVDTLDRKLNLFIKNVTANLFYLGKVWRLQVRRYGGDWWNGVGRCTVNNVRYLARPSAQGLEVMLHQRAAWELSCEKGDSRRGPLAPSRPSGPGASV